ncbi:MAG: radical SAM protein [Candidatus Alcyoniella australis]|nr:radical SAM protein [Candidatus Alcyoniella australis]
MKILLVNPLCDLRLICGGYRHFHTPIPPYGIASLAASLIQAGHEVQIVDHFADRPSFDQQVRSLIESEADLIGISLLTTAVGAVQRLIAAARQRADRPLRFVLGNLHATLFHEQLVHSGVAEYVIRGEGEGPLCELADRLAAGEALEDVAGLTYAGPDGPRVNPVVQQATDLDLLPFPAWNLLDLNNYRSAPLLGFDDIAIPALASRGCPFHCSFCAQREMGAEFRALSPQRVADYFQWVHDEFGLRTLGFIDACFPPRRDFGNLFADELRQRGLIGKLRFATELRVDQADIEVLQPLAEAGLTTVMLGFESGDQQVLDSVHKGQTIEQSRRAMAACKQLGLHTVGFFIIGLPGETEATIRSTARFAVELDCDIAKFNLAVPYPGTELLQSLGERGTMSSDRFERFSSWYDDPDDQGLIFVPQGLSARRLKFFQHWAMWRFYVRPRMILRHLRLGIITPKNMAIGFYVLLEGLISGLRGRLRRKI